MTLRTKFLTAVVITAIVGIVVNAALAIHVLHEQEAATAQLRLELRTFANPDGRLFDGRGRSLREVAK